MFCSLKMRKPSLRVVRWLAQDHKEVESGFEASSVVPSPWMVFILPSFICLFRKHCLISAMCQSLCQAPGIERGTNFYFCSKILLMLLFSPTPTGLQLFQTESLVIQHRSFPVSITWFWIWRGLYLRRGSISHWLGWKCGRKWLSGLKREGSEGIQIWMEGG